MKRHKLEGPTLPSLPTPQDGSMFKARVPFAPYFYLQVSGCACRMDLYIWTFEIHNPAGAEVR